MGCSNGHCPRSRTRCVGDALDVSDLDPLGALRFHVAERLDDLAVEIGYPSDDLVLGALAADVCRDSADPRQSCVTLLERLVSTIDAQRISAIVDDARLVRASSNNPGSFDEREVLQLATHLATPQQARDAYQLALALGPLPGWQREAIDQRYALIHEVLAHPDLTGSEATNLAAARRLAAQRLLEEIPAIERMRFAPTSYVLSHSPEELARQANLVEPLPRSRTVRVAVSRDAEPDRWKIDVACRDSHALLAHLTEVLTKRGLDIVDATIATWPDGGVLDVFVVCSPGRAGRPRALRGLRGFTAQAVAGSGCRRADGRVRQRSAAVAHGVRCDRARPAGGAACGERGIRPRQGRGPHGSHRDKRWRHP